MDFQAHIEEGCATGNGFAKKKKACRSTAIEKLEQVKDSTVATYRYYVLYRNVQFDVGFMVSHLTISSLPASTYVGG